MRFTIGFITLLMGLQLSYAAPPQMRPGKWEVKMKMEMTGMPQQMPPMTTTHCMTAEQARDPAKDVLERVKQGQKGMENCKFTQHEVTDHTARWAAECSGAQRMQTNGEITFDSDVAYHGVIKGNIEVPQGKMVMTQTIEARRIGECTP